MRVGQGSTSCCWPTCRQGLPCSVLLHSHSTPGWSRGSCSSWDGSGAMHTQPYPRVLCRQSSASAWMLLSDGDRSQEGSSCKQRSAGLVITATPPSPPAQLRDSVFLFTRSVFMRSVSCCCGAFPPFLLQLNAHRSGSAPALSSQCQARTQGTNETTSRPAPGTMGAFFPEKRTQQSKNE